MARILRYLTHPQVQVDPNIPVPLWGLSETGRERLLKLAKRPALEHTKHICSSAEVKAVETAEILAGSLGLGFSQLTVMGENDRSATGFLPPEEFEQAANLFFANPQRSMQGWERAIDAQARIVSATEEYLADRLTGDVLLVGHGAVGTLLYCKIAGCPIDRKFDQMAGGGNYFSVDLASLTPLHHWKPLEEL